MTGFERQTVYSPSDANDAALRQATTSIVLPQPGAGDSRYPRDEHVGEREEERPAEEQEREQLLNHEYFHEDDVEQGQDVGDKGIRGRCRGSRPQRRRLSSDTGSDSGSVPSTVRLNSESDVAEEAGATEGGDKIPVRSMIVVCAVVFASSFNTTMLYPFLGPMMKDLGIAENANEYGFSAGYIASAFMVGRTISSFLWGKWSDKYGRKPVCAFGSITLAILSVAFGFNFSYTWVGSMRLLSGILNGVASTTKTIISELCPESKQSQGMSYITATRGLGLVIGPAIGGILSEPTEKYPALFSTDGIFGTFKYLLPCLVCAGFGLMAYVLSIYWLPETLDEEEAEKNKRKDNKEDPSTVDKLFRYCTSFILFISAVPRSRMRRKSSLEREETDVQLSSKESTEFPDFAEDSVHKWPSVQKIISIYTVWSTVQAVCTEVVPLWSLAKRQEGGLGFTTTIVGTMFAGVGICLLFYQIFVFPRLSNYFGPIRLFRGASMIQVPLLLLLPLLSSISPDQMRVVALVGLEFIRKASSNTSFTTTSVLTNNSVPSKKRGSVNGLVSGIATMLAAPVDLILYGFVAVTPRRA
eukprot:gb/GECG01000334.1/.p1 GENE.gb/GECG01000334.1/~~gb/GECG01000334.1/.p1  ORF type:complete len:584 (+),score=48.46 gb/GECG01000334.1/:1-1752(+)